MNKQNYALEVLINGRPAKEYYKDGRTFIEGREATQYTLKLRNNSWKKILAVFSVDGIEVIEGKVASEYKGGYIVDPFSSIEIKGYRIDEKSVAAFRFAKSHKSYSNTVGGATEVIKEDNTIVTEYQKTTRNNGVIGVRIFEELKKDNNYQKLYSDNSSSWQTGPTGPCGANYLSGAGTNRIFYSTVGISVSPMASGFTYATGYSHALNNINSTNNGNFNDSLNSPTNNIVAFGAASQVFNTHEGTCASDSSIQTSSYLSRSNVNQMGRLSSVSREIVEAPDFNLGTTWGEKVEDKVKLVEFEKSDTYVDLEIYYDSRESLANFGVDFESVKQYVKWPSAFEEKRKFCKIPEGYNG